MEVIRYVAKGMMSLTAVARPAKSTETPLRSNLRRLCKFFDFVAARATDNQAFLQKIPAALCTLDAPTREVPGEELATSQASCHKVEKFARSVEKPASHPACGSPPIETAVGGTVQMSRMRYGAETHAKMAETHAALACAGQGG